MLLPATANQRPVIYVDRRSHLEAMGKDPGAKDGTGRFMRVLAESDDSPLLAPDLAAARLKVCGCWSRSRRARAGAKAKLPRSTTSLKTAAYSFARPGATRCRPEPAAVGHFQFANRRHAAAAVEERVGDRVPARLHTASACRPPSPGCLREKTRSYSSTPRGPFRRPRQSTWPKDDPMHGPVLAGNSEGQGQAFLLGDTAFALNEGLTPPAAADYPYPPQNSLFWQTTLRSWLTKAGN